MFSFLLYQNSKVIHLLGSQSQEFNSVVRSFQRLPLALHLVKYANQSVLILFEKDFSEILTPYIEIILN